MNPFDTLNYIQSVLETVSDFLDSKDMNDDTRDLLIKVTLAIGRLSNEYCEMYRRNVLLQADINAKTALCAEIPAIDGNLTDEE